MVLAPYERIWSDGLRHIVPHAPWVACAVNISLEHHRPTVSQRCIWILERVTGLDIRDSVHTLWELWEKRKQKQWNEAEIKEESDVEELVFPHGSSTEDDDSDGDWEAEVVGISHDVAKKLIFPSYLLGISLAEFQQWKRSFAISGFDGTFSQWFKVNIMPTFAPEGLDEENAEELLYYLSHANEIDN